jgi:hypothetical protein
VVLPGAEDVEAARDVRDVLLSDAGRSVLRCYGFVLPEN